MQLFKSLSLSILALLIVSCSEELAVRGVTDDEILIGSHLDLSGPASSIGVQVRNATVMAVDEVNAAGGVHGRKLRVIFEDNGYDPKKAVLASKKLLNRDKVFMMLHVLGTPVVLATMDSTLAAGVPHLFPFTGAEQTYEPFHPLKFAAFTPYYYQTNIITKDLAAKHDIKKFGILYQDDDFGLNVLKGVEMAVEELGYDEVVKTTYKRGSTDFNTQIARLKSSGVEAVALATIVRETAGAVKAARDLGWDVPFYCTTACYTVETIDVGGEAVEGLIAAGQTEVPYDDDPNTAIADWVKKYEEEFGLKPSSLALGAYINTIFLAETLKETGKDLTADKLVKTLEAMPPYVHPDFGGVPIDFNETNHLGAEEIFMAEVHNGRWVTVSDILSME